MTTFEMCGQHLYVHIKSSARYPFINRENTKRSSKMHKCAQILILERFVKYNVVAGNRAL